MSDAALTIAQRRQELQARIAMQRGELIVAYHGLQKPIHYTEKGLRAVSFLRQNTWIFVAAPAAVSVLSTVLSALFRRKATPPPLPSKNEKRKPASGRHPVVVGASWAWELFQLYRRVRPYFR